MATARPWLRTLFHPFGHTLKAGGVLLLVGCSSWLRNQLLCSQAMGGKRAETQCTENSLQDWKREPHIYQLVINVHLPMFIIKTANQMRDQSNPLD